MKVIVFVIHGHLRKRKINIKSIETYHFVGYFGRPFQGSRVVVLHSHQDQLLITRFHFEDLSISSFFPRFFKSKMGRLKITMLSKQLPLIETDIPLILSLFFSPKTDIGVTSFFVHQFPGYPHGIVLVFLALGAHGVIEHALMKH